MQIKLIVRQRTFLPPGISHSNWLKPQGGVKFLCPRKAVTLRVPFSSVLYFLSSCFVPALSRTRLVSEKTLWLPLGAFSIFFKYVLYFRLRTPWSKRSRQLQLRKKDSFENPATALTRRHKSASPAFLKKHTHDGLRTHAWTLRSSATKRTILQDKFIELLMWFDSLLSLKRLPVFLRWERASRWSLSSWTLVSLSPFHPLPISSVIRLVL